MSSAAAPMDKYKHSRHGQDRQQGAPKKQGGGRANWGKPGDELRAFTVSKNDPNYDSEEELDADVVLVPVQVEPVEGARSDFSNAARSLRGFKDAVRAAIEEYVESVDRAEFMRCIKELDGGLIFHQEIPKLAVQVALGRGEETRNRLANLLQYLSEHEVVSTEQMEHGFMLVANRLPDLALDVPTAEDDLRKFVNRAVAGEFLSDKFSGPLLQSLDLQRDAEAVRGIKQRVRDAVNEYLDSEDLAEFARTVAEIDAPLFQHQAVKEAVLVAMDRTDRERELVSYMIDALSGDPNGLRQAEVEKGFEILLQRVEDLYNDVPLVLQLMSCFLARAVAQESVPPAFLERVNLLPSDMGMQVVRQARVLLNERHSSSRLATIWGPGDGRSVVDLKRAVRALVSELFESGDVDEAVRCVREMRAPYFAHEVVVRLVTKVVDHKEREEGLASELLRRLVAAEIVSRGQLGMGFARVDQKMADLALDAPKAAETVARIKAAAEA